MPIKFCEQVYQFVLRWRLVTQNFWQDFPDFPCCVPAIATTYELISLKVDAVMGARGIVAQAGPLLVMRLSLLQRDASVQLRAHLRVSRPNRAVDGRSHRYSPQHQILYSTRAMMWCDQIQSNGRWPILIFAMPAKPVCNKCCAELGASTASI